MTQPPRSYDDQLRAYHSNLAIPEVDNPYGVRAAHSYLLPQTTSRLLVSHQHDCPRPSDPIPAQHHDGPNPSLASHPPHSPTFMRNIFLGDYGALTYPQPFDTFNSSGSLYFPPGPVSSPNYGSSPPALCHSTLDPTLYSNFCQQQTSSARDIQVSSVDERTPTVNHPPAPSLQHSGPPLYSYVDHAMEPYNGISGALYPCLWTEGGIVCKIMVPATRSHMNRHLHTHHGFGGSDARQTRCHWAGCTETMQQGSIARHMVTCHLQAKVTCPLCFKQLSRQDVISKHQRVCPAAGALR